MRIFILFVISFTVYAETLSSEDSEVSFSEYQELKSDIKSVKENILPCYNYIYFQPEDTRELDSYKQWEEENSNLWNAFSMEESAFLNSSENPTDNDKIIVLENSLAVLEGLQELNCEYAKELLAYEKEMKEKDEQASQDLRFSTISIFPSDFNQPVLNLESSDLNFKSSLSPKYNFSKEKRFPFLIEASGYSF